MEVRWINRYLPGFCLLLLFVGAGFVPLSAGGQRDAVKVIDGDSFVIGKREVRLYGIDAPEYRQECYRSNQTMYSCGRLAAKVLGSLISPEMRCRRKEIDKYDRIVAVCYADGKDINAYMVEQGMATAYLRYSSDYVEEQNYAKRRRLGIWQGEFTMPEDYRRRFPRKNISRSRR